MGRYLYTTLLVAASALLGALIIVLSSLKNQTEMTEMGNMLLMLLVIGLITGISNGIVLLLLVGGIALSTAVVSKRDFN